MDNRKNVIGVIIFIWPLLMASGEPEPAISPIKPYKIFIVEDALTGPQNLHQLDQDPLLTVADLKINVANLINMSPTHFRLILDHKKGENDTFEHEPSRTLQSYFSDTQSAFLFTRIDITHALDELHFK